MAQIRAILARGLLTSLARSAVANSLDLIDCIYAAQDAIQTNSFKQGRIYVSTSGSGQSHSFTIPQMYTAEFSPTKLAEQYQEFVEIYNDCASGYNGNQAPTITDSSNAMADLAAMLNDDRLQTVNAQRLDITGLRFPGNAMQSP